MSSLLFVRTRASCRTLLWIATMTGTASLAQGQTFVAPVVPWTSVVLTTPLLPAIVAMSAAPALPSQLRELESSTPARLRSLRTLWGCAWVATLAVTWLLLACTGAAFDPPTGLLATFPPTASARNALFFLAITLGSAVLVGADLAWIGPAALVTTLVFFGRDADQRPRHWARLLDGSVTPSDWVVTASLCIAAVWGYRLVDSADGARERERLRP